MMSFGQIKLKYEVLNTGRYEVLDELSDFKKDFYLAGNTCLALQIGHRTSIDFYFFTSNSFSNNLVIEKVKTIFSSNSILVIQNEINTFE